MKKFNLNTGVLFTVDVKGIAVVNKVDNTHLFINYPEAAVWSVLVENKPGLKPVEMLGAILGKNRIETVEYIEQCLEFWRSLNLIR